MKRTIIISIGVLVIVLLAAAWIYLLFFTNGTKGVNFGDLNIFPDDDDTIVVETQPISTPNELTEVALDDSPLQQLTTKAVIGYRFIEKEGGGSAVVFAEEGTGHMFEIDLTNNTEKRISNTTIADASVAVFSASGTEAVILTGDDTSEAFLGTITSEEESMELRSIPANISDIVAKNDSEVWFAQESNGQTIGRQLNMRTLSERVLFTAPFTSARVTWGESASGDHYIFPRPAARLPGYLYGVSDEGLSHTGIEGFGLSALAGEDFVLVGKVADEFYRSTLVNKVNGEITRFVPNLLPEKCVFAPSDVFSLYCAASIDEVGEGLPDSWYRGDLRFSDQLWHMSASTSDATIINNFELESGRQIDVASITIDETGSKLLFVNKLDNSLWLYDLQK